MKIKSQRDFVSGLMFVLVGAGFAIGATNYSMGTSARPGAGYFPFYIGVIICICGVAILAQALVGKVSRSNKVFVEWQALSQVLSVLLGRMGFAPFAGKFSGCCGVKYRCAVALEPSQSTACGSFPGSHLF